MPPKAITEMPVIHVLMHPGATGRHGLLASHFQWQGVQHCVHTQGHDQFDPKIPVSVGLSPGITASANSSLVRVQTGDRNHHKFGQAKFNTSMIDYVSRDCLPRANRIPRKAGAVTTWRVLCKEGHI